MAKAILLGLSLAGLVISASAKADEYISFGLERPVSYALAGPLSLFEHGSGLMYNDCEVTCSSDPLCIGFAHDSGGARCTTLAQGGAIWILDKGYDSLAWKYDAAGDSTCRFGVDAFDGPAGGCVCGPEREQNTPFGCRSALPDAPYARFAPSAETPLTLAGSVDTLTFIESYSPGNCMQYCSENELCIGYMFSDVWMTCRTVTSGQYEHSVSFPERITELGWRYDRPTGPQCNLGTNSVMNQGGLCECSPGEVQDTPFGCANPGPENWAFAEFTTNQASPTPFAGFVSPLGFEAGEDQSSCRALCLEDELCISYAYDPAVRLCQTYRSGNTVFNAPPGFYLIRWRWNAPAGVTCYSDTNVRPRADGYCFCDARTEIDNGPFGCTRLAPPTPPGPGPSQRAVRRSPKIMPGVARKASFA